ncbi:MAG: hypothetical protein FWD62_12570 [Betaproteobacteria bacterium]|nr:hypothetical protein [Betaproteobacteria bacterium]
MSKTSKRPEIVPPTPEEDTAIVAAALADPDAQPLTDTQLKAMTPMRSLKAKGRPKSMTDIDALFKSRKIKIGQLLPFGFSESGNVYTYSTNLLDGQFEMRVTVTKKEKHRRT